MRKCDGCDEPKDDRRWMSIFGTSLCEECADKKLNDQKEMGMLKTLNNSDVNQAKKQVGDLEIFGNGDLFKLLSKASSQKEGWMKSTKAMEIPKAGCVVQVTTQQGDHIAEALCFVPGVRIHEDDNGQRKLIPGAVTWREQRHV